MNTSTQTKSEDRPTKNQKGKSTGKSAGTTVAPPTKTDTKAGDQKPATPPTSGDQTATTKPKRKVSKTVVAWRELENFPLTGVISISEAAKAKNPKSRDAARRFSYYKDGMTVEQYVKVAKENGISGALANADVRWDVAKGFITVK